MSMAIALCIPKIPNIIHYIIKQLIKKTNLDYKNFKSIFVDQI